MPVQHQSAPCCQLGSTHWIATVILHVVDEYQENFQMAWWCVTINDRPGKSPAPESLWWTTVAHWQGSNAQNKHLSLMIIVMAVTWLKIPHVSSDGNARPSWLHTVQSERSAWSVQSTLSCEGMYVEIWKTFVWADWHRLVRETPSWQSCQSLLLLL